MKRLTSKLKGEKTEIDIVSAQTIDILESDIGEKVYCGEAITRLASFENFYDDLVSQLDIISLELEQLRSQDKAKSVKFKELMVKKLTNNQILILLKSYGIE